jgi:hypothetical protein
MSFGKGERSAHFSTLFVAVGLSSSVVLSTAVARAQSNSPESASAETKQTTVVDAGQTPSAETVSPGPGEAQRKALLGKIMEAKAKGIGITNYLMAFQALDQSVKSGGSSTDILKRVDSLNSSLDEQFKRSAILKVQKPAPPVTASREATSVAGAGKNSEMMKTLQSKYGDKIPADLKDKLGGADPNQLMEMLKNFKK